MQKNQLFEHNVTKWLEDMNTVQLLNVFKAISSVNGVGKVKKLLGKVMSFKYNSFLLSSR